MLQSWSLYWDECLEMGGLVYHAGKCVAALIEIACDGEQGRLSSSLPSYWWANSSDRASSTVAVGCCLLSLRACLLECVCVCNRKGKEEGKREWIKGIKETIKGRKHFCVCQCVPDSMCVVAMLSPGPNLFSKPHDPVRNSKWLMSGLTGAKRSMCVCIHRCLFACFWRSRRRG